MDKAQRQYEEAVRAYRAGELERAWRIASGIEARAPRSFEPDRQAALWRLMGLIALAQQRPERALPPLRRLSETKAADAPAHYLLGRALALSGDRSAARRAFVAALEREPRLADAHLELAGSYLEEGQAEEAEAVLRRGLRASSPNPALSCNLGLMLIERGEREEGMAHLAEASSDASGSPLIHLNAANGFKRCGENARALAAYDRALALDPALSPAHHNRGNLLLDLGRTEEALAAYRRSALLRRGSGAGQERDPKVFSHTTEAKLIHDLEQFAYLSAAGKPIANQAEIIAAHEAALGACRQAPSGGGAFALPDALRRRLSTSYNRILALEEGAAIAGSAVNPEADWGACARAYAGGVGIAFLDGFLRAPALEALRAFCLNSTIWSTYRYAKGYLGAFVEQGFACPLLAQIATELAERLPGIFAA